MSVPPERPSLDSAVSTVVPTLVPTDLYPTPTAEPTVKPTVKSTLDITKVTPAIAALISDYNSENETLHTKLHVIAPSGFYTADEIEEMQFQYEVNEYVRDALSSILDVAMARDVTWGEIDAAILAAIDKKQISIDRITIRLEHVGDYTDAELDKMLLTRDALEEAIGQVTGKMSLILSGE